MESFDVVDPGGRRPSRAEAAQRIQVDAGSRRIAFVWDYLFRGDSMFEMIQETLEPRWPSMQFFGHEEFGDIHDVVPDGPSGDELRQRLTALGVTDAVVGVGA